MMPCFIVPTLPELADETYRRTLYESVGHLNRKDRRTARGRQLIAEAENKALRAKIAVLEQENYDE